MKKLFRNLSFFFKNINYPYELLPSFFFFFWNMKYQFKHRQFMVFMNYVVLDKTFDRIPKTRENNY